MVNAWNSTLSAARRPMKRSGFKPGLPKIKEHRKGNGKPTSAPRRSKTASKGPKLPAWIRAIPESTSHGSGTLQKRLWRVVSDLVRIRDWYEYGGVCVASGARIGHWSEGDAGHWKSYAACNGLFKFNPINVHLQSKSSNGWGGQEIGHKFGEELKRRHGSNILNIINDSNRICPLKFTTRELSEHILEVIEEMEDLNEQPDYYARVVHLLSEEVKN